jgi:hypothetical protein
MSLQRINREAKKLIRSKEQVIVDNYKEKLEKLRTLIRRKYDRYELKGKLTFSEMIRYDRIDKLDKEISIIMRELYAENSSITRLTLRDMYKQNYMNTKTYIEEQANRTIRGILKSVNVTETINEEMAGLKWTRRFNRHRNEVIYQVQQSVRQGLVEGTTYRQMSNILRDSLEGDVIQPLRIVRTEGKRVQVQAQKDILDHANNQGVKMTKTWRTSDDDRVRDDHQEMNNVTIPYEDDFILPDGSTAFAPTLTGVAEQDINCRCFYTINFI